MVHQSCREARDKEGRVVSNLRSKNPGRATFRQPGLKPSLRPIRRHRPELGTGNSEPGAGKKKQQTAAQAEARRLTICTAQTGTPCESYARMGATTSSCGGCGARDASSNRSFYDVLVCSQILSKKAKCPVCIHSHPAPDRYGWASCYTISASMSRQFRTAS